MTSCRPATNAAADLSSDDIAAIKALNPDGVATFWMSLPRARYPNDAVVVRFYTTLLDRVRALPGVRGAGIASRLPLETNGMSQDPFYPEGDASYQNKIPPLQLYTTVDGEYFRTMGIPLVAGRPFGSLDAQRSDEAIISQATAHQFFGDSTGRSVIGKRFREDASAPWHTIIGVVGSTRDTASRPRRRWPSTTAARRTPWRSRCGPRATRAESSRR
jgi:hypothetical protein